MSSCPICIERSRNASEQDHIKLRNQGDEEVSPSLTCQPSCLILEDPRLYPNRKKLWSARIWEGGNSCREVRHNSQAYHGGGPTLVTPTTQGSHGSTIASIVENVRNMSSPLDEMVFYWTKCADRKLIDLARRTPVDSAYYLLKFIAYQWSHQLELIAYSVGSTEWFADGT